ncbi:MAG: hypothetical protein WC382_09910 [Methanoregulaceae archaeon]|jgi:hypothetical protein
MYKRILLAVILFLVLVFPVAAAGVTRSVDQGADGTATITLVVPAGATLGITEAIPEGAEVTSCSLPAAQWQRSGGFLHLALLDEPEASYTLTGITDGDITGTWVDFSNGSRGAVTPEGEDHGPVTSADAPGLPETPRAGSWPVLAGSVLAALASAGYILGRRSP